MKRTVTKEHEATAKELLGYGPDVVMAGGAKKMMQRKAKQVASGRAGKGEVFLNVNKTADGVRSAVEKALSAERKKGYGKNGEIGLYAYIRDLDVEGKKCVYECDGKMYGREFKMDEAGNVTLGKEVPVKEKKTYETV